MNIKVELEQAWIESKILDIRFTFAAIKEIWIEYRRQKKTDPYHHCALDIAIINYVRKYYG